MRSSVDRPDRSRSHFGWRSWLGHSVGLSRTENRLRPVGRKEWLCGVLQMPSCILSSAKRSSSLELEIEA